MCLRLNKQALFSADQFVSQRESICIAEIFQCIVNRMRYDDNILGDYFRKNISNRIGAKSITTAIPNKITLDNGFSTRQTIKASVKNPSNFALIELVNFMMRMCNTDLYFVEHSFGANKELTISRIGSPNNSRSAIHFGADERIGINKPIKTGKITRQDGVFRML